MTSLLAVLQTLERLFLGQTTKSRRSIGSLDGIRGMAVLLVFASHTAAYEGYLTPFYGAGAIGVWLFFVLSAFLLTSYFLERPERALKPFEWVNYGVRRVLRIYPLFVLVLTADYLLYQQFGKSIIPDVQTLFGHLTLRRGIAHYWTIPIEIQFYVLLPILVLLLIPMIKTGVGIVLGFFAVLLIAENYFYPASTMQMNLETSVFPYICVFATGSIAAAIYVRYRHASIARRWRYCIDILGVFILIGVYISIPANWNRYISPVPTETFYQYYAVYGIAWGVFLLSILYGSGLLRSVFETRLLRFTGKISFGIYLTHLVILVNVDKLYEGRTLPAVFIMWALTLVVAMLLHLLIERPAARINLLGGRFEALWNSWLATLRGRRVPRAAGPGFGPRPLPAQHPRANREAPD